MSARNGKMKKLEKDNLNPCHSSYVLTHYILYQALRMNARRRYEKYLYFIKFTFKG